MVRRGARYTPEEALSRIPTVAKRVALEAVDLVITLENYPVDSHEVERRLWALTGMVGLLSRLCHRVWKYEGVKRGAKEEEASPTQ